MNYASQPPSMPNINPKAILDMNYAFAQTALLMAAVRLHILTYLANDPLTAVDLATLVKTQLESVTRLLEGLRTLGLIEREGDLYRLTPIADCFLNRRKAQ